MRSFIIKILLVSTLLISFTLSFGQEVKFTAKPLRKGSISIDSSKMNMSFSMRMKANGQLLQKMHFSTKNRERKKETVLKVI